MNYLLNLTEIEKLFFIESMNFENENKAEYDAMKIKAMLGKK